MITSLSERFGDELNHQAGPGPLVDPPRPGGPGPPMHSHSLLPHSRLPIRHRCQTRTRPVARKDPPMEARHVQLHLRRCGVVVHHAARMPSSTDGRQSVVIFLEGGLQQFDLARRCALKLPGVRDVSFSGHTNTIMYVSTTEPPRQRGTPTPCGPADEVSSDRTDPDATRA